MAITTKSSIKVNANGVCAGAGECIGNRLAGLCMRSQLKCSRTHYSSLQRDRGGQFQNKSRKTKAIKGSQPTNAKPRSNEPVRSTSRPKSF